MRKPPACTIKPMNPSNTGYMNQKCALLQGELQRYPDQVAGAIMTRRMGHARKVISEEEKLNGLRTVDISANPLCCDRDTFEAFVATTDAIPVFFPLLCTNTVFLNYVYSNCDLPHTRGSHTNEYATVFLSSVMIFWRKYDLWTCSYTPDMADEAGATSKLFRWSLSDRCSECSVCMESFDDVRSKGCCLTCFSMYCVRCIREISKGERDNIMCVYCMQPTMYVTKS